MAKQAPNHDTNAQVKKRLNVILWVLIALVAALVGGVTIWASKQPEIPSIWAPD